MIGASSSFSRSDSNSSSANAGMGQSYKLLGTTTTANPYVTSTTTNGGTTTNFVPGTAMSSVYNFTNAHIDDLLNQYLNPSLDNPVNQARMQQYQKNLAESTRQALENNIIAPLAQRNMLRSSQATDLYNTLNKQNQSSLDDFNTSLIANSQNDTANMINTLMNLVYQGYNALNGNQAQSLQTSMANGINNSNNVSYGSGSSTRKNTEARSRVGTSE